MRVQSFAVSTTANRQVLIVANLMCNIPGDLSMVPHPLHFSRTQATVLHTALTKALATLGPMPSLDGTFYK